MSEAELVKAIIEWFKWHSAWAVRVNSGKIVLGEGDNKRMFRGCPPGTPDVIACYRGRFVAIECKIGTNKPTETQAATLAMIAEAGGYARVAYSVDDVIKLLMEIKP